MPAGGMTNYVAIEPMTDLVEAGSEECDPGPDQASVARLETDGTITPWRASSATNPSRY